MICQVNHGGDNFWGGKSDDFRKRKYIYLEEVQDQQMIGGILVEWLKDQPQHIFNVTSRVNEIMHDSQDNNTPG